MTTIPTMRTLKVKPLALSTIVRIGRMTMNDKGRFHEKKVARLLDFVQTFFRETIPKMYDKMD